MFADSIDNKINKIKLNLDSYLNDKKKEPANSQPVPANRRPQPPPNTFPPNQPNMNPMTTSAPPAISNPPLLQPKPVEIQIKQLMMHGKTFDRPPLLMKCIQKQKAINIIYTDEQQIRIKIQIKVIENGLEIRINPDKSSIEFSFKRASRYKFVKPENGQPKWLSINNELKEQKITLLCNKDGKTLKNSFEGVVPQELIHVDATQNKSQDKERLPEGNERDEAQDVGEDVVNFQMPTLQQLTDTQKFRRALKDMKEQEKTSILMEIYKVKRQYDDPTQIDRKKLKCPIQACQKIYREISQLKTHLKKHPELNKHGIQLTDYGIFQYGSKAMDLALYLGKLYPREMKKIIKKMKTRQAIQ